MAAEKPTSRRDFLKGKAAARALASRLESVTERTAKVAGAENPVARRNDPATARITATRRAMACSFVAEFHAADGARATDAALAALDLIERIEDQLTVYRDQSEVTEINARAALETVVVEPQLYALLQLCAWLHEATGGAFDITSGPLSKVWGFFQRNARMPEQSEIDAALARMGGGHLLLNDEEQTIHFLRNDIEINFNSIGKGYALDLAGELVNEAGVCDFLWHGGNSSVLARGTRRGDSVPGWPIGIPHPLLPGRRLGEVRLVDRALGTAGGGTQFFEAGGRRFSHVIDPRSGWPAENVYSATALADSAAEADALATAFFVMGPAEVSEYCHLHQDIAAIVICPAVVPKHKADVDVHLFNLDEQSWRSAQI